MTALLLVLLLAPGDLSIRVRVEGAADEVLAFRDGALAARAPVRAGEAVLEGLPPGAYDLRAQGEAASSDPVRGVRAVSGGGGHDAVLAARPAFPVTVETEAGATVWCDGLPWPDGPPRLPAGLHRLVVDHPARLSGAERLLRVAGPLAVRVDLDPGLAVSGVVRDARGAPVPGARVEAFTDGFAARRETFADEEGRFSLLGFAGSVCSLRVTAPGHAARLERLLFRPGAERTRAEVVLAEGSAVTLTAVHGEHPLAEAEAVLLPDWYEAALEEPRLRVHHEPVRDRGAAPRFAGLRPGRRYRVVVRAPGFLPAATEPFAAPGPGETLAVGRVALERGAVLEGRLAAAGLFVVCQGPYGTATCRTDRQGRWVFDGLDAGEYVLWVRDVDETGVRVRLDRGERRTLDLEPAPPPPERFVAGIVLDADARPLAGVETEAAGRRAVTDAEGRFRLEALPRGPDRIAVAFTPSPASRAFREDPHLAHVERRVVVGGEVRVQLPRAGTLRLRLDAGDHGLARARVHVASGAAELRVTRRVPRGAREVEIADLPAGTCVVELAAPGVAGTAGAVARVEAAPAEAQTVAVLPGRSARGRVVLRRAVRQPGAAPAFADLPHDRGWVALLDFDPLRADAVAPIEADGTFYLEGLPRGPVVLCASAPGLPVATLPVDLAGGDREGLEIMLEPGAEAAVRVMDPAGRPLPDARVRVISAEGYDARDLAVRGRFLGVVAGEEDKEEVALHLRLVRDGAGRIAAPFLLPGSWLFRVSHEGFATRPVGVRARSAWTVEEIRETAERELKDSFPSGPPDLATPVHLAREEARD